MKKASSTTGLELSSKQINEQITQKSGGQIMVSKKNTHQEGAKISINPEKKVSNDAAVKASAKKVIKKKKQLASDTSKNRGDAGLSREHIESKQMENTVRKKVSALVTSSDLVDFSSLEEIQDEEYMNKKQLDYFQNILDTWRNQLHAERDATVQHMQEDPVNFPDLLDRAALEEEHKFEWQTREREYKLIIKIEKALAKIKQGDYGYCEKCGAEIGLMRLQVRPTATLCVDCKAIDEIRERQTGVIE